MRELGVIVHRQTAIRWPVTPQVEPRGLNPGGGTMPGEDAIGDLGEELPSPTGADCRTGEN
ncbi:MAG TPA: hypothetical protein DDY91_12050 [Planctomycetaceae bacterium]|nr:hypothetical protein [Planctomycetaceae bacterium]